MKRLVCSLLSILLFSVGTVNMSSFNASAESQEYLLSEIADKVKIVSRAVETENGYEADFAGGGISFALNCYGDVSLGINWTGQVGMLGVVINDDFENVNLVEIKTTGEQTVIIAKGLESGEYTFEVTKLNAQYTNQVVFKSITFSGTLLDQPPQKELKIEFYGDSISCGVGALSESINSTGVVGYEDSSLHSYGAYCARVLNAEISTCALPGYGYLCGYDTGKGQNVYPFMDKALVNKDVGFDHSQFLADIVVIELGTNDRNYVLNHETEVKDKEIDACVQDYIDKIRSYNKDCYIILLGTINEGSSFNVNSKGHYIKLANALLRAASVNEKTYYIEEFAMGTSGRGYHPKASQAKAGGEKLATFITENILSGKEPPKVIANEDFYLNFDINGDDLANTRDALGMRNYLIKKSMSIDEDKADINNDGKVDMKDMLEIRKYLANK